MASKHSRDQAMDFQGFLNDLQDWELSLKDKDKKMTSQASVKEQLITSQPSNIILLSMGSRSALPRIFKNALSASLLVDIVKCVANFFREEVDLAIKYLENLTKVPRFDMLILFLSPTDKADLLKVRDEVFCNEASPTECAEILGNLRSVYCLKK